MKVKGKAIIQLFNDQNEKVHEVVEENIVTNALARIATLEGKPLVKGSYTTGSNLPFYHLPNITPFATQLLGGLLLFGNTFDEDPDIIIPPVGSNPVGHAGAPYSGSNPYRGTYNETESGPLFSGVTPIGYRHVWDFGTDKANGTIESLCLTSKLGGNTGWRSRGLFSNGNNELSDPDSMLQVFYCASSSLPYKSFSTPTFRRDIPIMLRSFSNQVVGRLIHVDEGKGDFYFAIPYSSNYQGVIAKVTYPEIREISIFEDDTSYLGREFTPYITANRTQFNYKGFFEFDNTTGNVKHVFVTNGSTLIEEVYSPTSGVVSTKSISISGSGSTFNTYPTIHPFAYRGFYYAQTSDNKLLKLSSSGEILASFDITPLISQEFIPTYSEALDRIVLRRSYTSSSTPGVAIVFDGETLETFRTGEQDTTFFTSATCSSLVAPGEYVSACPSSSYSEKMVYYAFYSNYLATINNLAEPIVKTSSTTMKITYDVYVEE